MILKLEIKKNLTYPVHLLKVFTYQNYVWTELQARLHQLSHLLCVLSQRGCPVLCPDGARLTGARSENYSHPR